MINVTSLLSASPPSVSSLSSFFGNARHRVEEAEEEDDDSAAVAHSIPKRYRPIASPMQFLRANIVPMLFCRADASSVRRGVGGSGIVVVVIIVVVRAGVVVIVGARRREEKEDGGEEENRVFL